MPHIGIVIVHYNSEKETRACLESLKKVKKTGFSFSVVVVDNGSKEVLQISQENMPSATEILRSDANLGFTSGNNLGINYLIREKNPDYFLLLNNDTVVAENFLTELLGCAEAEEKAGVVVPKIYFSPNQEFHSESYDATQRGKVIWYAGGRIDWSHLDAFHQGVDEVDRGQFDDQVESEFATGCCMLIPRKVLDQVGLFDEKYFLYFEDVDLSLRIRTAGYRILFCPQAVIWHQNAGSSGGSGSGLHLYYQTRNRLYFFSKYAPFRRQLTLLHFVLTLLLHGSTLERSAVIDWVLGRMGKQSFV